MSSTALTIMQALQTYVYRIVCPVLIFFGIIGCFMNMNIYGRKSLRRSPCSVYFIAYNLSNFFYITAAILSLMLSIGYNVDLSAKNLIICRVRMGTCISFNVLSPSYLILASIDRVLITSVNARTRRRSTHRLAYILLGGVTLFWILLHSHAFILGTITELAPNYFICYFQMGIELTLVSYYSIVKEFVALLLMITLGLKSIRNIRTITRVRPLPDVATGGSAVEHTTHLTSSKDRQLIAMLIVDTMMSAVFSFMYGIFLLYEQITEIYIKSDERIQMETIIRNICLFAIGIPFCTSFYTNLIASRTFRKELKDLVLRKLFFC